MSTVLGSALAAGLVFTVYTPWLRDFFDFDPVEPWGWIVVGIGVASALAGQYIVSTRCASDPRLPAGHSPRRRADARTDGLAPESPAIRSKQRDLAFVPFDGSLSIC